MARAVVQPAVLELVQQYPRGRPFSTTVTFGGDDFTMCAHVRAQWAAPGQVKIALACWVVNMDTARYLGDNPPADEEKRLSPEGTAGWDEELTGRVIGHLATRMNALTAALPTTDEHLTITVPLVLP
ncbi:hypothetical protein ACKI1I_11595 [Streptomyces turgidiscabies]|uniref:Uncharacterized protein n=1 Tax=Streptomyces turgidiscabies (strain Car8) TaxID=698760 RepID=L7EWM1_STRT8|nr:MULTISPECIES: hypothetical protein [Streptomyces]ELP63274.1 hypothetical protein STRTUCAR8_03264 [Streptomyces turgidiscabies Car8]MDX3494364.1 hypothetical protein [Streptomyces turgidiscabies]